jgi:outer membrane lipoprotein carrier protein
VSSLRVVRRCIVILLAAISGPVFGADHPASTDLGYQRLETFMRGLQSLTADFHQVLRDSHGQPVEESQGLLMILRPGRFIWNYREPHPQQIVSDGAKLWFYDKDLDQVTVRRLDTGLAGTPAMLLSGEGSLQDSFNVTRVEQRGRSLAISLTPKHATDFNSVELEFDADVLRAMELADKLGQTTTLQFSNFKRNPKLDPAMFKFVPPPGVDVIGDAAPSTSNEHK